MSSDAAPSNGWTDLPDRAELTPVLRRLAASTAAPLGERGRGRAPTDPSRTPDSDGRGWEIDLVLDRGPTDLVWADTVQQFAGAVRDVEGFRRVGTHVLPGDQSATRMPESMAERRGRRIVLLLTDGASPLWRAGQVDPLLRRWARRGPVAVAQLLPHTAWQATGFLTWPTQLRSPFPGAANHRLEWRAIGLGPNLPEEPGTVHTRVPVPVLQLEPEWLSAWADLLTGPSPWVQLPVLFTGQTMEPLPVVPEGSSPPRAADRVGEFRSRVTPDVFALATVLAATPLTLPLIAEVQRAVVPAGRVSDVAELVVHGLLRPTGQGGSDREPAFLMGPGIREALLANGRKDTLRRVVRTVGRHLGPQGEQLWRLPCLLQGAPAPHWGAVDADSLPWAQVEQAVLQALSGEYLTPARELELLIGEYLRATATRERRSEHHLDSGPRTSTHQEGTVVSEQITGTAASTRPKGTPTVWGNIPPRNPNFTGREALLESLHRCLLRDEATAVLPHALHGMGGVGKSLLAVEYLYRRLGEYDVVWWIPAERTTQISLSLVELAPRLGLQPGSDSSSTVSAVLEALRRGEPYSNWLLVFDNAESPEAVSSFFPSGGPGNILITSRNPQWASIARPLEVDVFRREESKQLLRVRGPEISDEDADRLAEALGDLPLAVEQAAAWHAETGMLADEYLRLLAEKRIDLLSVSAPLDYQLPVIAAWNISLDQLESKNPAALQLLQVCSFCAPEPISRSMFARMQGRPIAPELDAALADPIRLGQVIREIGRYSLARFDHRTNSIQMHRLVQTALLSRMTEEERIRMRHGTHLLLAANDPNDPTNTTRWTRYGELFPHVLVSEAVHSKEPWVRTLVINEVKYLMYWGDYEPGRSLAQTAYDSWRRELGTEHPQTLEVARWLGFLLFSMGRYAEAAILNTVVLEAYRSSFGEQHQDTVDATGNVAIDRRVQGEFAAALELSRTVHRRYLRLLGPEEPETLRAAHNLGVSLRLTGDFSQAQTLDEATWHSWTQIYGQDHVDSLRTWLGLILDIRELGDYAAALTYHREIVEQSRKLLGPDNPMTLSAARHLAVALRKAGHHDEARTVADQARTDLIRRYGENNPESMAATLELTVHLRHPEVVDSARQHSGELRSARTHGDTILKKYEATYGADHPHTLSAAVNLAITHRLLGDPGTALDLDRRVLAAFRDRLGDSHPASLVCRTNLASDHYALGDVQAAEALDQETLTLTRAVFDGEHPSTLACAANLSMDLRDLGRTDEASVLHAETVEKLGLRLGAGHPAVIQAATWDHRADCDIDPMPL